MLFDILIIGAGPAGLFLSLLLKRLGRAPAHTYMYGHSAGARIGHGLNYTPGLNAGRGT